MSQSSYIDEIISSLTSTGKKISVIIEFGAHVTKIGYSGESKPRFILDSDFMRLDGKKLSIEDLKERRNYVFDDDEWKESILLFITKVYYEYIMCDPEGTRLIVIENPLTPMPFKTILRDVMTNNFKVHSLIFLPSQPLALIPLEKKTGIVVDVGYSETNVISVVSGSILNHTLQSELMGKRDILKKMESCLRSYPSQFKNGEYVCLDKDMELDILDDIVGQVCYFAVDEVDDEATGELIYTDKHGDIHLLRESIRHLPCEVLFKESEHISVAEMVLESLLKVDIDSRKKLTKKLVIIGGGFNSLPGFHKKLLKHIENEISTNERYQELKGLSNSFNILESLYFDHYMLSWVGASILSAVENVNLVSKEF